MSAASQPMIGQTTERAPFGAVALIAGILALGALGIAMAQSASVTPAGIVPADVQAALSAHRMSEKAALNISLTDPRFIVNKAELDDRFSAATYPASILGPQTDAQKGLVTGVIVNPFTGFVVGTTNQTGPSRSLIVNPFSGFVVDATAQGNRWTVLSSNEQSQKQLQYQGTVNGKPTPTGHPAVRRHR